MNFDCYSSVWEPHLENITLPRVKSLTFIPGHEFLKKKKQIKKQQTKQSMATFGWLSQRWVTVLKGERRYPEPPRCLPTQTRRTRPNSPPQSFASSRIAKEEGGAGGSWEGLMRVWTGRRRDTPAPWRSLRQLISSLTMIAPVKITAKIHGQPGTG